MLNPDRPPYITDIVQAGAGKQIPLKQMDSDGFQPAPLFHCLYTFSNKRYAKFLAEPGNGAHYRLFYAAKMYALYQSHIYLDLVWLKPCQ